MKIEIREAFPNEAERLTEIAFAAKRTWKYPNEHIVIWKDELTISKQYISRNTVYVAKYKENPIGFYSIITLSKDTNFGNIIVSKGFWMDHLFIDPKYQHNGIGRKLVQHALDYGEENCFDHLKIFVDPNAIGFYDKMGAKFIENSPSSIEGRDLPIYGFDFEEN